MPVYKIVFTDRDKPLICEGSVIIRDNKYKEFIQFMNEDTPEEIIAMVPIEKVLYIKKTNEN